MTSINNHLQAIILSLEQLTKEERFPAYVELYDKYTNALSQYERSNDLTELKINISQTTRMLLEAPPNNYALGLKILNEMTALYAVM